MHNSQDYIAKFCIIVENHGIICKILILYTLGIGDEHFWDIKFYPGSITILELKYNRYTLIFGNDKCYIDNHAYFDF
ncbi:MAG TPA: histidine phosphatase family protein [Desulfatiglandales bacterium]|nr:histidine phosphatase family protein [Desulfatiglandales bacterium]